MARRDQKDITDLIEKLNRRTTEAEQRSQKLDNAQNDLQIRANSLDNAVQRMNVASFVAKLRYDFYHLRELDTKIEVRLKPTTTDQLLKILGERIEIGKRIDNKFVPHAQFHPNGPRTTLEDSDGIIGWRENQILFTFYEDKILGQHIKILDDVDTIAYEFVCKATESMKLDALLTGIQKLELAVVVNRATLCKVVLDVPSVTARWKDEDGDFWVQFRSTLPLDRRGVIYQYERLYEAEASEFGQKPMSLPIGPGILKGPHEAQKGHQTMAKPRAGLAATDTMR